MKVIRIVHQFIFFGSLVLVDFMWKNDGRTMEERLLLN